MNLNRFFRRVLGFIGFTGTERVQPELIRVRVPHPRARRRK